MSSTTESIDLSETNEKARKVLVAVSSADTDDVETGAIRKNSGVSGGNLWNNAQKLIGEGLLEQSYTGEAGVDANRYRITDAGEQAVREFEADDTLPIETRLSHLESEVTQLQAENESLRENQTSIREQTKTLASRFESFRETMKSENYVRTLKQKLRTID